MNLHGKLELAFVLIFAAIAIQTLLANDVNGVYENASICISYRNNVFYLSIFYHLGMLSISIITGDRVTVYSLVFCLLLGVFQTVIADNHLCQTKRLEFPLNRYENSSSSLYSLTDCIPTYMIFCWSIFAFIEIKIGLLIYNAKKKNRIVTTIISSLCGYIVILLMEILTNLANINIIALWKANDKLESVNLFIGGLATYLIIPELCLCFWISIIFNFWVHPHILSNINDSPNKLKYLFVSTVGSGIVTMMYCLMLI